MLDDTANRARLVAVLQALLVTFLWSSSWVLIKLGFRDPALGPLGFAGLRYTLAAALLLPLALRGGPGRTDWLRDRGLLGRVALLGLVLYTLTQGAQFAALRLLPAAAVNLALAATPVAVAAIGAWTLGERPGRRQLVGIVLLLAGVSLYLGPLDLGPSAGPGLAVATLGLLANAASTLLGRSLARDARERLGGALPLTAWSMGLGGLVLLLVGFLLEGTPPLTPTTWLLVAWLAVVNTALAFTLWTHTQRTLSAVESSVVNTAMTVQIPLLAFAFLGEPLGPAQLAALGLALAGILLVQLSSLGWPGGGGRRRPAP